MPVPVLIPAYKPGPQLIELVQALEKTDVPAIVVIDDGSGPDYRIFFEGLRGKLNVHLLRHAINLGKGAALKSGINYVLCNFPNSPGIVTADADGQHHPEDIVRVANRLEANSNSLILGARVFDAKVPLRSRFGNTLTRQLVRVMIGHRVQDTQTGLRGIPRSLLPHLLRLPSSGYEFELDMLITAKHHSCPVREEPIQTIYIEGNKSSHFNPILDSMRIYFLLFRFGIVSALTALLDNAVFATIYWLTGGIWQSQIVGRVCAMLFNYTAVRSTVFHTRQRHQIVLPKYALLVLGSGLASYGLINFLHYNLSIGVLASKLLAEGLLFIANFTIQRDFVFTRRQRQNRTDWDSYYKAVPITAQLTRKYTSSILISLMRRLRTEVPSGDCRIVELGGANSCFLDRIVSEIHPSAYHVVDTNEYGLNLLRQRLTGNGVMHLHRQSVLDMSLETKADLVFSVGLIEHFDAQATRKAILAHFDVLRPGGCAIITFPTPTPLYRITRFMLESIGMWKFHDERPLLREEVVAAVQERGEILYEKLLWPLILTQHLVFARKKP